LDSRDVPKIWPSVRRVVSFLIMLRSYFRFMERERCGKWMPRKKVACARRAGHSGDCHTPEAMERARAYGRARRATGRSVVPPEAQKRYARKHRLKAYGLTQERFDQMLAEQGNACAMCREPFREGQRIAVDHDHACCDTKLRSCGKCVRGLLCHLCNAALGHIEHKSEMARAYLGRAS